MAFFVFPFFFLWWRSVEDFHILRSLYMETFRGSLGADLFVGLAANREKLNTVLSILFWFPSYALCPSGCDSPVAINELRPEG